MRTCGDHGGRTIRGTPCGRQSPEGLCAYHAEDGRATELRGPQYHPQKRAFLAAIAETGNLTIAARAVGIDRRRHYDWLANDREYEDEFREAMETAADLLEAEARRRAVEGVAEPVFYQGKPVGAVRRFDSTLLIFMLKGIRPEKYRERSDVRGQFSLSWAEMLRRLDDAEAA